MNGHQIVFKNKSSVWVSDVKAETSDGPAWAISFHNGRGEETRLGLSSEALLALRLLTDHMDFAESPDVLATSITPSEFAVNTMEWKLVEWKELNEDPKT